MHIVLVDSSSTILKIMTRLLKQRGYEVYAFSDPQAALDFTRAHPYVGVLLTSVEFQTMSGLQLCVEARQIATSGRPLYVILMSANDRSDRLIEALDSGADDFIRKPPVTEELYARLRAAQRVTTMQRELFILATTDPLTRVLNRRAFFEEAARVCAPAVAGEPVSAIMLDLDRFKTVNDNYGHAVGDEVLREVALTAQLDGAIIGRLGGEEFSIILPWTKDSDAMEDAEELRRAIGALVFETSKGSLSVTCSLGVAAFEEGDTLDTLLRRADAALYVAKAQGRNRVVALTGAEADLIEGSSGAVRAIPRE